jgi:ABC-type branched-subunit amino acid transport system substrate-binding protein
VPDVPQNGDPHARTRFSETRAKFLRDGNGEKEFRQIAEDYPEDPIAPFADLYAGIAAIKERHFDAAAKELATVVEKNKDPGLTLRAELFLGIAKNYQGDPAGSLPLLRHAGKAVENDDERTEYLAALAYATAAASQQPLSSLPIFDQLYARVSPTEKAAIIDRLEMLVAAAQVDALKRAYDEIADRNGPSMAVVASRLSLGGDPAMKAAAATARAAVGMPKVIGASEAPPAAGDAGLIGAIVPLAGKTARVGEAAVAGLGLAAGVPDGHGVAAIEMRTAADPEVAVGAVDELARANVVAIVGPVDGASVDAASAKAESLGVPLISLATRPEERTSGKFVFHVVHSAEARARALAQRALAKGVKSFAILAPESGYGRSVTAAFIAEITKGGGTIATKVTYPAKTESFANFAGKLGGTWDALFVPEQAETLALIVPALATAGKVPKPYGYAKKVTGGRAILLLSTAEGLTNAFLTAGRHAEGSLLAPGFYPDDTDALLKPFVDRFTGTFGRTPGSIEAYAYDAAELAAAASAGGRGGLASTLASGELAGVTGTIKFDADHRRSDPGVLFTVVEDVGAFVIRAVR